MKLSEMSLKDLSLFIEKLEFAGFNFVTIKKIIESENNQQAKDMYTLIDRGKLGDPYFELVNMFKIKVPNNYDHDTQLASMRSKMGFYIYDKDITDQNFSKTTDKLKAGQEIAVSVFKIVLTGGFKYLSWDYCLDFMKTQKSLFLGIQGMSLAYELQKEELYLSGGSIYSLDKRENLFKVKSPNVEEKIPHNPVLDSRDSDTWSFQLSNNKCSDGDYILCFREYKRTHKVFEFI